MSDQQKNPETIQCEKETAMKTACPVCESRNIKEFLRREPVPVHQNLLLSTPEAARTLNAGRLVMMACRDCSFVFNAGFQPELLSYGENYDNSQNFSPAFVSHLNSLVQRLVDRNGVVQCRIVEVGCGKGDFLNRLTGPAEYGNHGYGFDPAYAGPETINDGRTEFHRTFYSEESSKISADVVISRHVIEHIPDPRLLLRSIRAALANSPDARVFFETPCVEWILRNEVAWDFFYEHCSLFTGRSLALLFEECGFRVDHVDHVFGGQYLWLEATLAEGASAAPAYSSHRSLNRLPEDICRMGMNYGATEARRNQDWTERVQCVAQSGNVALWGAGAKGVTFANLIDADRSLFRCVVDTNPGKQNRFLAGTGHPIISPDALPRHDIRSVIVLNPNYCEEIRRTLADSPSSIRVINLMEEGSMAA
jgi:SAM-dependent methyltransferase